jgi:hypothetical protein
MMMRVVGLTRYDRSMEEKMDEWKRGYYKVRLPRFLMDGCINAKWMGL